MGILPMPSVGRQRPGDGTRDAVKGYPDVFSAERMGWKPMPPKKRNGLDVKGSPAWLALMIPTFLLSLRNRPRHWNRYDRKNR